MLIVPERFRHIATHEFGACYVYDHSACVSLLEIRVLETLLQTQKRFLVQLDCKLQLIVLSKSVAQLTH